jgi:hypothetical protein
MVDFQDCMQPQVVPWIKLDFTRRKEEMGYKVAIKI